MKIHHLPVDEVLLSLHTSLEGLSDAAAQRRLREFGPNRVEQARRRSPLRQLLAEFTHFFAVILWAAAGLALFAAWQAPGEGMATLGGAIVGVIVINGLFSFWQVYRAERALLALAKLLPHRVKARRDGTFVEIDVAGLVPGDIVTLSAGDLVSADCRLIEAFGIRVNNATVTGESLPRARNAEPCQEEDLLHADNIVLAGTTVVSGEATAVVFATGMHTEFGQIAHLTQSATAVKFPLQREIVILSRIVAIIATALGVVFFLIGWTLEPSFWRNLMFAIGIIVANVPEGLLPTVTLALAMGAQRMARRNVLIRHLPAVETLGCTTVICTDKTGTLTENRMRTHSVYLGEQLHAAPEVRGLQQACRRHARFFETLLLCHDLKASNHDGQEQLLGDPTEVALVEFGQSIVEQVPESPRLDEVPFDSDRKRLSTLHQTPAGNVLYTKGALEAVLPLCARVRHAEAVAELTEQDKEAYLRVQNELANQGLRVLAVAYRELAGEIPPAQLERELTLAGLVSLEDPPRPEVAGAIETCRTAGIKVVMITGDHPHTAVGVARQIGLVRTEHPRVVTGDRLRRMRYSQLQMALDAPEVIFARVAANQKMLIVQALQRKGEIVAVTGDGVNDAPALRQADIGIAMGMTGTDVARESADMVLADDNFASIVAGVEEGRAVFDNVRKFLTYILTSNIPEVVPYLAFVLLRIPLPLTIIQILAVDLGTDMLPALALGAESPDPDIMRRPPRARQERLLTPALLARAYLFLGVLEAVAAMAAYFFVLSRAGWEWGADVSRSSSLFPAYLQATTACLAAIVVSQVVNVYICRSGDRSVFSQRWFSNRLILWGIGLELVLMAVISYTPLGHSLFGTAPLPLAAWWFMLPFAAAMLGLEELRKWCVRRWRAQKPGHPSLESQ